MVLEDGEEHTFPLHNVDQLWDGDCSWPILAPGAGTWVGSGAIVAPLTRRTWYVVPRTPPESYIDTVTDWGKSAFGATIPVSLSWAYSH